MYVWQISLAIALCMAFIDLLLRGQGAKYIGHPLDNSRKFKVTLRKLKEANSFLWLLICITGIISNISLLVFILSIPIYFIFHI